MIEIDLHAIIRRVCDEVLGIEVADLYAEVPSPSSDEPPAVAS